jgi:hypothetical protein
MIIDFELCGRMVLFAHPSADRSEESVTAAIVQKFAANLQDKSRSIDNDGRMRCCWIVFRPQEELL